MKKTISVIVLILILMLSISYASSISYKDVNKNHWAYEAIDTLSEYEFIQGYPDYTFKPSKGITRAEFSKVLVKLLELGVNPKVDNTISFVDVQTLHWAYEYINKASPYMGYSNKNYFYPERELTRQEAAMAMVNALDINDEKCDLNILEKFSDKNSISDEYELYIALAVKYQIMNGNANGTFNPTGSITRAEIIEMIYNILVKSQEIKYEDYSGDIELENVLKVKTRFKLPVKQEEETKVEENIVKEYIYQNENQAIFLNVMHNGILLVDGRTYTVTNDDEVIATIENPSVDKNNIYYMFSYGKNYQTTVMNKASDSETKIVIPEELTGGSVRLSIWGTSIKGGRSYVTSTEIFNINYIDYKDYVPAGEKYGDQQTGVKVSERKIDFIVVFDGRTLTEDTVGENAKRDQKIIIRGKPVNNVKSINYKWDNETKYTSVEDSVATISIPDSFANGTKHKLTIMLTDKAGRTYVPRRYIIEMSKI